MRAVFFLPAVLFAAFAAQAGAIEIDPMPDLQQAVSNNAVTLVATEKGVYLYSFLGLGSGKTWQDISSKAVVLNPGADEWTELQPVPGGGRLAASAVTAGGAAWVFGGYTVAADGSEKSIPGVYRIEPGETQLTWATDMPIPVEDSVMLVYQDRYIYLVSGWHDLGNVNLVQVLDSKTLQWTQATPWPGAPVFGHAGGITEGKMLICDGVRIQYPADESAREFLPSKQCWVGRIDAENHRRINWHSVPPHPGGGRYRMAATGDSMSRVVFAGGSLNPYNFNGIGYDGAPSNPESPVFSFDFSSGSWHQHGDLPQTTMDHRGLPFADGWYYLIGGMQENQTSVSEVYRFRLEAQ
jgi:N-acetylneuraminic acid mutarotase